LRGNFADRGFHIVPFDDPAEVYVVNTCTVTGLADAESRKIIRRALRRKPEDGLVVVTGCYAQRDPEALRAITGVDLVLGNSEKSQLLDHVQRHLDDRRLAGELWVAEQPRTTVFLGHGRHERPGTEGARTRATLKIQDGCNEKCTYCIIPSVRGMSVSREPKEVLAEARQLAALGYREIALTGVNTGCYGHDLAQQEGLAQLIQRLQDLDLPLRYRLNSLEPLTVSKPLLAAIEESPAFCRHFHVPLQHGDSRIQKRMGRTYEASFYADVIQGIHERFPLAGIGADLMVGFPGEEEEHFEQSHDFVASLPLSYLHVFTYSMREGTSATRMPGHIDAKTKQQRSRKLHQLEDRLRTAFQSRLDSKEEIMLVESKPGPSGRLTGLCSNYLRVELAKSDELRPKPNEFWRVRLEQAPDCRLAIAWPQTQQELRATPPAKS
jgi:threonylcarbamoyladenosine tRNA methylthiotransferase MtaB